jgi:hypothetical protein
MNRAKLRRDFEKSFPYLDKSYVFDLDRLVYLDTITHTAWLAWVAAFETYSDGQLLGKYYDDLSC